MSRRRRTFGAAVAAAMALAVSPAVALTGSGGLPASDDGTRAVVDLTGAQRDTVTLDVDGDGFRFPEQARGIGPGSHLLTDVTDSTGVTGTYGCTASWVYTDGATLYLAAAGHCFLPEDATATHGPDADHEPADSVVHVCVADCTNGGITGFAITGQLVELGPLAYARQEAAPGGDQVGHDFGLVEIPRALHDQVRLTMPVFGGPHAEGVLRTGDQVCHYGNGVVVGELFPTMGRTGVGLLADDDAWFAATPAAPGDSGSAIQTCAVGPDGPTGVAAIGTLTHLSTLGVAGTTNARAAEMAAEDAGLAVDLVLGSLPPLGGGDGERPGAGDGSGPGDGGDERPGRSGDRGPGDRGPRDRPGARPHQG